MKLIDLLVKELPSRGGWPDGAVFAAQDANGMVNFSSNEKAKPIHTDHGYWVNIFPIKARFSLDELGAGYANTVILKADYEKALSKSRPKPIGRMMPVITSNNDVRDSFEFISINHTELHGRRGYLGDKKDGSAYHCHDVYWIPEMYEKKSDKEVVEDAIKEATKNILDSLAKMVVGELVNKSIKEIEGLFRDLNSSQTKAGIATKPDGEKKLFNPLDQYFAPDNVDCRRTVTSAIKTNDTLIGDVDFVNHPPHYQSDNGIECIDAIRAALGKEGFIAHCQGTAIKYLYRAPNKDAQLQDLKKAAWYVQKAIEEMEKNNGIS